MRTLEKRRKSGFTKSRSPFRITEIKGLSDAKSKLKNIAKGTTDPRVEFIFPK